MHPLTDTARLWPPLAAHHLLLFLLVADRSIACVPVGYNTVDFLGLSGYLVSNTRASSLDKEPAGQAQNSIHNTPFMC